ncbi:substrate-binding domain-containing protein [Occultella glacieicola]|uniref:substrate-binding domain-containing protein n=1 Tax=Occultella glacieicola TaxID=2518684 RepID=UPI0022A8A680|nr:substrate-binding domain-containing protein [Occultella glacieicola]
MRAARHDRLLRLVRTEGVIVVSRAAASLGVTEVTIRRDLAELAEAGLLERVHGGAVLPSPAGPGAPRARPALRIGFLTPNVTYYFGAVIKGAESAASALGYRLIYGAHFSRTTTELRRLDQLGQLDVDGLIVTPGHESEAKLATYQRLDEISTPLVVCERPLSFPDLQVERDRVSSDHAYGALLGLQHLASLGHHRVTWVSVPTATFAALEQGVTRARATVDLDLQDLGCALPWEAGRPQAKAIVRVLDAIERHDSTALFIHSDIQAVTVLEAVLERGWRVPEDLTLLTYDDELAADASIPISAVSPAKRELGTRAVELLHRRIEDRTHSAPIEQAMLLPRLQVRASSGPPRRHPLERQE